jgi:cytochrome b6-f complex iron-sulfur subunit
MPWSRRTFLKTTAAGSVALSLMPGCGNDVRAPRTIDVTVVDDETLMTNGAVEVSGAQLPPVGGAVTLQLPSLRPSPLRSWAPPPDGRILLLRYTTTAFSALQSTCPHAGCPLGYNPNDTRGNNPHGQIECPCHSSRFRAVADVADKARCAGLQLHLPAQANLLAWPVVFDGTTVTIDLTARIACNNPFPAPVNGVVTLQLSDFPQLTMVGGAATGQPGGFADTLIVARVDQTTVAALSAVCTHLGCTVDYDPQSQQLDCPCHASIFALDGSVLMPPAPSPLKSYQTTLLANAILISLA